MTNYARSVEIDEFVKKALTYDGTDCLIWPFGQNGGGYAAARGYGIISRYICEIVYGAPPTFKHQAAHSCGKGHLGCINRKHLRWATRKENAADDQLGEDNHRAKLTEEQVIQIRRLYQTTWVLQYRIAEQFGISKETVKNIIRRETWAWLEEPSDAELIFATTRPRMKDLFA